MTYHGLVYTKDGMSLYWSRVELPGSPYCTNVQRTHGTHISSNFRYPLPYKKSERRTCLQKYPPLVAADDAKPGNGWTVVQRADSIRQWAHEGHLVYTSIDDKVPGQVNAGNDSIVALNLRGGWRPLQAPFLAPDGIKLMPTTDAIVLADAKETPLYTRLDDALNKSYCFGTCAELWRPVVAAAGRRSFGDWTIVPRRGEALGQWAYKGQPLYYGPPGGETKEARPAAVYHMAKAPAEFGIRQGPAGSPIYVDKNQMTLYVFTCIEESEDTLSCDRIGDASRYYESFCGGPDRCADIYRLARAPADAVENDVWTVRDVVVSNPLRPAAPGEKTERVWLYKGRLVFQHADDVAPGDFYGIGTRLHSLVYIQTISATLLGNEIPLPSI
jgi:predicted lipoprotein with Yx(FWY)xxD motif